MVDRYDTSGEPAPRAIRHAWLLAFVATIALIASLGLARSAQALAPPDAGGATAGIALLPPPDEPEAEAEAEPEEAEECETGEVSEAEAEEEGEPEEEGEECGSSGPGQAPPQCLLTSAVPTVSASRSGKVRLAIRYTAVAPVSVDVDYWLHGARGPLTMSGDRDRFGTSGVYRETARVTDSQLAKVLAAKSFTIRLRPHGAPGYCRPFQEIHLTSMHASHGGITWSGPKSS
jgi:hypothetical protein